MSGDNIESLFRDRSEELFLAERRGWKVCVEGREIPRLSISRRGDDKVTLLLDERFAIDVPNELAHPVAWMLANALAIGEGYPFLGAETKDRPFAPKVMLVGGGDD